MRLQHRSTSRLPKPVSGSAAGRAGAPSPLRGRWVRPWLLATTALLLVCVGWGCGLERATSPARTVALDVRVVYGPSIESSGGTVLTTLQEYAWEIDSVRVSAWEMISSIERRLRDRVVVVTADTATTFSASLAVPPADHYWVTVEMFGVRRTGTSATETGVQFAGDVDLFDVARDRRHPVTVVMQEVTPRVTGPAVADDTVLSWPAVSGAMGYRIKVVTGTQTRYVASCDTSYTHAAGAGADQPCEEAVLSVRAELCWVSSAFGEPVSVSSD